MDNFENQQLQGPRFVQLHFQTENHTQPGHYDLGPLTCETGTPFECPFRLYNMGILLTLNLFTIRQFSEGQGESWCWPGGFTTNALWCIWLNVSNKTGGDYFSFKPGYLRNLIFCALAGVTWYLQFMFYGMGTSQMGEYEFTG
jgi:hypothetical protein